MRSIKTENVKTIRPINLESETTVKSSGPIQPLKSVTNYVPSNYEIHPSKYSRDNDSINEEDEEDDIKQYLDT